MLKSLYPFQGTVSALSFCLPAILALGSSCSQQDTVQNDDGLPQSRVASHSGDSAQQLRTSVSQAWKFWVDPESQARTDANTIQPSDGPDARRLRYIADQAAGVWYGEWSGAIGPAVAVQAEATRAEDAYGVYIAYNIPYRDCGQHSAGGASASEYRVWIRDFAAGLGSSKSIVILEPDALTLNNCLSEELKAERYDLLRDAVRVLKQNPTTLVYIDAGHSAWLAADETAQRLKSAGIDLADGFALNTSNYQTTESNVQFGYAVQQRIGKDKRFVIDTSRNGAGPSPSNEWCNPRGRALGRTPTTETGIEGVAAFLWLKRPGESDGACNGGPAAGAWWREMALELARNAGI